jgi:hypothetical protein
MATGRGVSSLSNSTFFEIFSKTTLKTSFKLTEYKLGEGDERDDS